MAALDVSGKDDGWILAEDFPVMDVPKGPVIVSFGGQLGDRTGCIGRVPLATIDCRVQDPDIEETSHAIRAMTESW